MEQVDNRAIELLKMVLLESSVENEFDADIYEYLKEIDELPEDYVPYWLGIDEFEEE